MHAVITGDDVPSGDGGDGAGLVLVDVGEDFAVHVFSDGEVEEVEEGGADVEEVGSVEALVFFEAGSTGDEDAELAVLGSGACGFVGDVGEAEVVWVEAVV